jgi:hypothetical protein
MGRNPRSFRRFRRSPQGWCGCSGSRRRTLSGANPSPSERLDSGEDFHGGHGWRSNRPERHATDSRLPVDERGVTARPLDVVALHPPDGFGKGSAVGDRLADAGFLPRARDGPVPAAFDR